MRKRWIPSFLGMLKYMEQLGDLGASRVAAFYSDGDGDFRPKFEANDLTDVDIKDAKFIGYNDGRLYDAG